MKPAAAIGSMLLTLAAVGARDASAAAVLPLEPARHITLDTREGTWLSPDLSPDGATVVFELLGDLFTVDAHGGGATRALTTGLAFDSQPVFYPDGRDIAFVSDRSGAENVWIIAADGSHPRQLTALDDNSCSPRPPGARNSKRSSCRTTVPSSTPSSCGASRWRAAPRPCWSLPRKTPTPRASRS